MGEQWGDRAELTGAPKRLASGEGMDGMKGADRETQRPGRAKARTRRQAATPGRLRWRGPCEEWAAKSRHASSLLQGGSFASEFCLGLCVPTVTGAPAASSRHPAAAGVSQRTLSLSPESCEILK